MCVILGRSYSIPAVGTAVERRMEMSGKSRARVAIGAVLAVVLTLAAFGGVGRGAETGGGTLQVWLGGDLTQATPGSPTRKWLDLQVKRFQAQNPGWDVKFSFLSFDNAQTAAKLTAAFSSGNVPDVINHWGGSFATAYADELLPLNKYVRATPGLYASMPEAIWDAECVPDFRCQGGKHTIIGVPWNASTYVLFYNKKLFAEAGIKQPPKTYTELFAACKKLSDMGITPVALGAKDGYTTSNSWTTNLVSTLAPGDIQRIVAGKMPYDDPKLIAALEPVLRLTDPSTKCTSPNALGQDQLQGTNPFLAGQAAMAPYYPLQLSAFRQALGSSNVGIARQPLSGHGPLLRVGTGYAGTPSDGWIIPKATRNADMAWRFVKIASDAQAQKESNVIIGLAPANTSVVRGLKDEGAKLIARLANQPAIQELDQVMPNSYALALYRELALGQLQKQSAADALHALQKYVRANPVK
jgi:ABC-type glycerol-3-phosphate transport system substrate-binding protein